MTLDDQLNSTLQFTYLIFDDNEEVCYQCLYSKNNNEVANLDLSSEMAEFLI